MIGVPCRTIGVPCRPPLLFLFLLVALQLRCTQSLQSLHATTSARVTLADAAAPASGSEEEQGVAGAEGEEGMGLQAEGVSRTPLDTPASSTHCNVTGHCIPCTSQEMATEAACKATGFRQQVTCVERPHHGGFASAASGGAEQDPGSGEFSIGVADPSESRSLPSGAAAVHRAGGRTNSSDIQVEGREGVVGRRGGTRSHRTRSKVAGRSLRQQRGLEEAGEAPGDDQARGEGSGYSLREQAGQGAREYVTFESCSPVEDEALSVLGFEAIVLSLLAVCAPIVYQRKRKALGSVAMVRLPTNRLG